MSRRSVTLALVVLSAVAFVARAGVILHLRAWQDPQAMEHRSVAKSLIHGNGFAFGDWGYYGASSVQSPPYPFLLAISFETFGDTVPADGSLHGANLAYFAMLMLNAVAGAGLVWLTYAMARTLGGTALIALLAAAAVALWPSQIYAARAVQAIELITCGLVAGLVLFYSAVRTGRVGPWIGFSIIGCVTALTEPVFLPALVLSGFLVFFWPGLDFRQHVRNGSILFISAVVLIGPWTMRNYIVHGAVVPVKNSFWVNVWKGNNDYASGTDRVVLSDRDLQKIQKLGGTATLEKFDVDRQYNMLSLSQQDELRAQPEIIREHIFRGYAMTWIKSHPRRYAQLCGIRLVKSLTIDWDNPKSYNTVYVVSRYALLGLTIFGLPVVLWKRWSLVYPAVLYGTALLSYTLTVTAARFSLPFEPIQLCLGAAFIGLFIEPLLVRRASDVHQPSGIAVTPLADSRSVAQQKRVPPTKSVEPSMSV